MSKDFYSIYHKSLEKKYSRSFNLSPFLISPYILELPSFFFNEAEKLIKILFSVRNHPDYQKMLLDDSLIKTQNNHFSVLMAYDFHLDLEKKELSLIEVNTNAAAYLIAENLYEVHGMKNLAIEKLIQSFEKEMDLFGEKRKIVSLIDEDLKNQKMYPEFLMFESLFKKRGYSFYLEDLDDIKMSSSCLSGKNTKDLGFIYNRYCDFYFQKEKSSVLKKAYENSMHLFSPNPREYALLSSKKRLCDWSEIEEEKFGLKKKDISLMKKMIPQSFISNSKKPHWSEKKKYVFKPQESYGSKEVYLGKSITKKMFEKACENNFLCQEYRPAGKTVFNKDKWKFDIRFYVYQDEIQQSVARIYKGQLTQFSELGSGFCSINWT